MPGLSPTLVLYAPDPERTKAFYEAIGLPFVREQHGGGPVHYACDFHGHFVLEIYPMSGSVETSGPGPKSRLVINVVDIVSIRRKLKRRGDRHSRIKRADQGPTMLVRDPDGREILLIEPEVSP
jgi:catechol 2,3-dioxygenase-like lactoylglutathione lyase family enzyme